MFIDQCDIKVRYGETDQMGIVYHANYFSWFDVGRTSLLRNIGYSCKELENSGLMIPVIKVECEYKHPAKYDDDIIIESSIEEIKGVKICFQYKVYRKEDGQLLARGRTIHATVNKEMKPINFKKYFPNLYEKLVEIS